MALSGLTLVEIGRAQHPFLGRAVPRLARASTQLDVHVDGVSLLERAAALDPPGLTVWTRERFVSVADLAAPGFSAAALRRLAGWQVRDEYSAWLEPGRLPLYVCPLCGDLCCGALTVVVQRKVEPTTARETVRWSRPRFEPHDESPALADHGPFTFDAQRYDAVLREAVIRLELLAADDDRARQQRRGRLDPRRLWRRRDSP